MTAETEAFAPVVAALPEERPLHVIALSLAKREAATTTTSMTMSYRAGCTVEEAIGSAVLAASRDKPGFAVESSLIYTFEATTHDR